VIAALEATFLYAGWRAHVRMRSVR
jgi:hypothetical protein